MSGITHKSEKSRVLVVFYSLEGHCNKVAKHLAQTFGYDTLELRPIKNLDPKSSSKQWLGRLQVLFNQSVTLHKLPESIGDYDLVLLGTPVWMGTFAPAVQSFISEMPLKDIPVGLFTTYERDAGEVFSKLQDRLKDTRIVGEISIAISEFESEQYKELVDNWVYSLIS